MSQVIPRITVLTEDQIAEVHARSLEILATVGVRVDSPRARDILARATCGKPEDGRVVPATHYAMGADFPLVMIVTATSRSSKARPG